MTEEELKALLKRFEYVEDQRDTWNTHYQELADFMLPRKAEIVKKRSKGEKRMEQIFDGTALQAVDLLASSLHGMLTSGASPWFHLDVKDTDINRDDDVREWLQDTSMRMMRLFNQSNFETEVHELYVDLTLDLSFIKSKFRKSYKSLIKEEKFDLNFHLEKFLL